MLYKAELITYEFYNKDWFIAADVVKHFKLSSNYNTYYSKYYSNGRLYGPVASYEFRLSGTYLEQFKELYGANNASLNKTNAVWLIDKNTAYKLLNKDTINSKDKTVKTVESNALSISYNLDIDKNKLLISTNTITDANVILDKITQEQVIEDINKVKQDFRTAPFITNNSSTNQELIANLKELNHKSTIVIDKDNSSLLTYSPYSEEEISDAITLISSKLTNSPYQQEKILDGGSIRLDLFTCTRRSVYAIELKKNTITLEHVKEKLDNKNYIKHLIEAYPDLNITFIFSSPKGIAFDALMYLQEGSKSIGEHKIIYKPTSNLLLDMINKKEKDLPSYYYKQILDKPIIKYLLQVI